ncbi:MAG: winged helix-turn-helix transcriptional regulator [Lachnospiraceae bacterium]|nr:winged helix-turn-helix transcriptional regulator [Lachnospiraceae bacterium]
MISRYSQIDEITEVFRSDTPSSNVYIITGVRGSGKTVTMALLMNNFRGRKDWITISLNPNSNLLQGLAANLYACPGMKTAFAKAKIGLSFGVNAEIYTEEPAAALEVRIKKMMDIIKKKKKKVLIAVDEASNSENMRAFAGAFQMFLYEGYPVFMIMTGLYDNVRRLQDNKTLTFLYRAPRFELKPLGINAMANDYREVFLISEEEALEMARFTKGYSYAFQVAGYLKYKSRQSLEKLIPEFDAVMEEYAYEKIWSELSERDREVIELLAKNGKMKVQDIIRETGMTSGSFSTYRRRLSRGGLISVEEYGYCEICLPRFGEIVRAWT